MKSTFLSLACLIVFSATTFAIMPNEKVLKSFQSAFDSPSQVKWFEHKGFYEVSFIQMDIRVKVKYDLDGNFISSFRYYGESQLPSNITLKLKSTYPGKEIFGVTEVTTAEEINYYVKVQDAKRWYTIKITGNGQSEIIERYKKA